MTSPRLPTRELEFDLPESAIATSPASPRHASKLMILARSDDAVVGATVRDLPTFLNKGDLLVLNDTRVLPAWIEGRRVQTGGQFTGLYLGPAHSNPDPALWRVLLKGRHLHPQVVLALEKNGKDTGARLTLLSRTQGDGGWVVRALTASGAPASLDAVGSTPIPPYIRKARKHAEIHVNDEADRAVYQTVFAQAHALVPGSVAAPTAGLHFTQDLLADLARAGVTTTTVTLAVGAGTFKPVETEFVDEHPMHEELCSMSPEALAAVRETRARGGRVIAVGTTAARTLESYAANEGHPPQLSTRLLITPGYRFRWVDALLTNFHLPRSTLLALVGAFLHNPDHPGHAGLTRLKSLYAQALAGGYRFFSYGDAMLILP
jgi:S-adenosylmethionine:tRNA ribosyltransferase-isomerase